MEATNVNGLVDHLFRHETGKLLTSHSAQLPEEMIAWHKEVEDLIGLEAYYRIESETVER